MPKSSYQNLLEKLKKEVLNCKKCSLWKERTKPVFGEGSLKAKVMFVGEAPGYWEDKKGKPFVGRAGKFFDELLNSIGLRREKIYLTNILKCRPPKNRDPKKEEIEACFPYLKKQIEIIKPKIICALGRHSVKVLMKKYGLKKEIKPIEKIHGKVFKAKEFKIIPFYHPAFALYQPNKKEILKKDFKILKKLIK